jgi:Rps23 Pro-64 3,4-dihydroxylase Tpa1-like proline 4-hydroxylase
MSPTTAPLPPHHRYDDFLAPDEHRALLDWTLASRPLFQPSTLAGGVLDPTRRKSERLRDLGPFADLFRERLLALADDIFRRTGTKPFAVDVVELEAAAHGEGAHFKPHRDIAVGAGRRRVGGDDSGRHERLVSAVYYYHREPKGFGGGALRLYRFGGSDAAGDHVDLAPEQNSLVVFPSWATHAVREVSCPGGRFEDSRFAVNAWLCKAAG